MPTRRKTSLSPTKPHRGRPPENGRAMSNAERARRYRARRKRAGIAILNFDPRIVRAGRPLSEDERHQLRDALHKIKFYQREIERLTARNAELREALAGKGK